MPAYVLNSFILQLHQKGKYLASFKAYCKALPVAFN
jgi:hypothetical protein